MRFVACFHESSGFKYSADSNIIGEALLQGLMLEATDDGRGIRTLSFREDMDALQLAFAPLGGELFVAVGTTEGLTAATLTVIARRLAASLAVLLPVEAARSGTSPESFFSGDSGVHLMAALHFTRMRMHDQDVLHRAPGEMYMDGLYTVALPNETAFRALETPLVFRQKDDMERETLVTYDGYGSQWFRGQVFVGSDCIQSFANPDTGARVHDLTAEGQDALNFWTRVWGYFSCNPEAVAAVTGVGCCDDEMRYHEHILRHFRIFAEDAGFAAHSASVRHTVASYETLGAFLNDDLSGPQDDATHPHLAEFKHFLGCRAAGAGDSFVDLAQLVDRRSGEAAVIPTSFEVRAGSHADPQSTADGAAVGHEVPLFHFNADNSLAHGRRVHLQLSPADEGHFFSFVWGIKRAPGAGPDAPYVPYCIALFGRSCLIRANEVEYNRSLKSIQSQTELLDLMLGQLVDVINLDEAFVENFATSREAMWADVCTLSGDRLKDAPNMMTSVFVDRFNCIDTTRRWFPTVAEIKKSSVLLAGQNQLLYDSGFGAPPQMFGSVARRDNAVLDSRMSSRLAQRCRLMSLLENGGPSRSRHVVVQAMDAFRRSTSRAHQQFASGLAEVCWSYPEGVFYHSVWAVVRARSAAQFIVPHHTLAATIALIDPTIMVPDAASEQERSRAEEGPFQHFAQFAAAAGQTATQIANLAAADRVLVAPTQGMMKRLYPHMVKGTRAEAAAAFPAPIDDLFDTDGVPTEKLPPTGAPGANTQTNSIPLLQWQNGFSFMRSGVQVRPLWYPVNAGDGMIGGIAPVEVPVTPASLSNGSLGDVMGLFELHAMFVPGIDEATVFREVHGLLENLAVK